MVNLQKILKMNISPSIHNFTDQEDNLVWRFGHKKFATRTNKKQIYYEDQFTINRPVNDLYTETKFACKKIQKYCQENQLKIAVCMSGGLDSEAIVKTFLDCNIPIETFSIRYNNDLNFHDLQWQNIFCNQHGIKPNYINFDIENWLSGECDDLCQQYNIVSPILSMYMWLAKKLKNYFVIFGDGDVDIWKPHKSQPMCTYYEKYTSIPRFFLKNKIQGTPFFWAYTAELDYAFHFNDFSNKFIKDNNLSKTDNTRFHVKYKKQLFHKNFNCVDRPKFNGTEMIKKQFNDCVNRLKNKINYVNATCHIPFDTIKSIREGKTQYQQYKWIDVKLSDLNNLAKQRMLECGEPSVILVNR